MLVIESYAPNFFIIFKMIKLNLKNLILSTPISLIFLFSLSFSQAEDLVLHLEFDKLSGLIVKDKSNQNNHAIFNFHPKIIKGPLGDNAVALNATSWAKIVDNNSLDLMEKFTIEAWILTRSEEKQIIVEKGSTWNRDGEFALLFYTNRRPVVQARDLPDNCDDEAVGAAIKANTWTHLAGTWDSKTFRLFINGEENINLPCAGKLLESQEDLFIGSRGGSLRFLDGSIDDLRIYNYALNLKQIKLDMAKKMVVQKADKISTSWARIKNNFF